MSKLKSLIIITSAVLTFFQCNPPVENSKNQFQVNAVGAMRDVKWKGQLQGIIDLDSLKDRSGLYGLGPLAYLKGEIVIDDGEAFISRVTSDSTMEVENTFTASAPFFVYSMVDAWDESELPANIRTLQELEKYIEKQASPYGGPFAFKITGRITYASIHVQNLPDGTTVSSPEEAHQGQVSYRIKDREAKIIGFFSKNHQGVFTHHDSFIHTHLITHDHQMMGHVDELEIESGILFLPAKD